MCLSQLWQAVGVQGNLVSGSVESSVWVVLGGSVFPQQGPWTPSVYVPRGNFRAAISTPGLPTVVVTGVSPVSCDSSQCCCYVTAAKREPHGSNNSTVVCSIMGNWSEQIERRGGCRGWKRWREKYKQSGSWHWGLLVCYMLQPGETVLYDKHSAVNSVPH